MRGLQLDDWIQIPSGQFLMGSAKCKKWSISDIERPHIVQLDAFRIMKTPVTFEMYDRYCLENDLPLVEDKGFGRDDHPVIGVPFWDAVDFCVWFSKKSGWQVRLPTEAEWEYACRAGTTTQFWTGGDISQEQANFDTRPCGHTVPVEHFPPNPWGLYDMHGNAFEWCGSEFDPYYSGKETEGYSGEKSVASTRVLRGGSWFCRKGSIRSSARYPEHPDNTSAFPVFRLAMPI